MLRVMPRVRDRGWVWVRGKVMLSVRIRVIGEGTGWTGPPSSSPAWQTSATKCDRGGEGLGLGVRGKVVFRVMLRVRGWVWVRGTVVFRVMGDGYGWSGRPSSSLAWRTSATKCDRGGEGKGSRLGLG